MRREFTASTGVRNFAIAGSAFFGLLFIFTLFVIRPESFWARIGLAALSTYLVLGTSYDLLYFKRFRVIVDGSRLLVEKPFRSREMDLSNVTRARWRHMPTLIQLTEDRTSLRLDFGQFPPEGCLSLIELLREAIPRNAQQGWEVFCHRIALPMRRPDDGTVEKRPLEPDEVLLTRRSWDRFFLWCLPAVGIAGGVASWVARSWFFLVAALVTIAAIWLCMRVLCLQGGMRFRRMTLAKEGPIAGLTLAWLAFGLAGIWLSFEFRAPDAVTWLVAGLWMLVLFAGAWRQDKRRTAELEQAADGADAEWNRLLAAGTAELPE